MNSTLSIPELTQSDIGPDWRPGWELDEVSRDTEKEERGPSYTLIQLHPISPGHANNLV